MTTKYLLALSLSVFVLTSCAKQNTSHEDITLKSYRLIDEQRTDEAITLIENELKNNPDNYQIKVVLASAYAHKAGFKIQKIIPAFSVVEKLTKSNKYFQQSKEDFLDSSDDSVEKEEDLKRSKKLSTSILKFAHVVEIFDSLPHFSDEQVVFLDYAISILDSLDSELKSEDVVYRALLNTLKVKHKLNKNFYLKNNVTIADNPICKLDFEDLNANFQDIGLDLLSIMTDLERSNPDKEKELSDLKISFSNSLLNFNLIAKSINNLDDSTSLVLKQILFQANLGTFAKCQE